MDDKKNCGRCGKGVISRMKTDCRFCWQKHCKSCKKALTRKNKGLVDRECIKCYELRREKMEKNKKCDIPKVISDLETALDKAFFIEEENYPNMLWEITATLGVAIRELKKL